MLNVWRTRDWRYEEGVSNETEKRLITMNHFTQHQLQNLVEVIDLREKDLRTRIVEERERANTEGYLQMDGTVGDEADQAFAKIRASIENEMIDRHLNELTHIAAARARLTEGSFGLCIECGIEIEYERLLAQPAASRCADCQTLHERVPAA